MAFRSPDGSYFFINPEGVFLEKFLWFVPFKGVSRVTGMGFDPGTRKLTLRIQNGSRRQHDSEVIIDVPSSFPGERLERLSAAFRDGDGRSALAG